MREVSEQGETTRGGTGTGSRTFPTRGPKTVPQVDYERIFVTDTHTNLLGEYALNDECPLESSEEAGERCEEFFHGCLSFLGFR